MAPDPKTMAKALRGEDPFGNTLRLTEPLEPGERAALPDWS